MNDVEQVVMQTATGDMEIMYSIQTLPSGVRRKSCPGCEYIMGQLQIESARFNFDCPRCKKYTLNDFVPWPPKPKHPTKPRKRKAA